MSNLSQKTKPSPTVAGDGTLSLALMSLVQRAAVALNGATTTAGEGVLWTALHGL
jgi:hypothetical protein